MTEQISLFESAYKGDFDTVKTSVDNDEKLIHKRDDVSIVLTSTVGKLT